MNANPCGCDPDANWMCARHRAFHDMRRESHVALTAQAQLARVNDVPELSTLTAEDRRVIGQPATRAARQLISTNVQNALPLMSAVRTLLPSYVRADIDALLASFVRWESDEQEVVTHG